MAQCSAPPPEPANSAFFPVECDRPDFDETVGAAMRLVTMPESRLASGQYIGRLHLNCFIENSANQPLELAFSSSSTGDMQSEAKVQSSAPSQKG
jgi:hypothetical protein